MTDAITWDDWGLPVAPSTENGRRSAGRGASCPVHLLRYGRVARFGPAPPLQVPDPVTGPPPVSAPRVPGIAGTACELPVASGRAHKTSWVRGRVSPPPDHESRSRSEGFRRTCEHNNRVPGSDRNCDGREVRSFHSTSAADRAARPFLQASMRSRRAPQICGLFRPAAILRSGLRSCATTHLPLHNK